MKITFTFKFKVFSVILNKYIYYIIQSNLSIADTCGSWKKCPLLPGVRYIEVFNMWCYARVVLWLEKTFKKITENIDAKVAKCLQ